MLDLAWKQLRRIALFLGGMDLLVLISLLVATLALLAFIQIADEVAEGDNG